MEKIIDLSNQPTNLKALLSNKQPTNMTAHLSNQPTNMNTHLSNQPTYMNTHLSNQSTIMKALSTQPTNMKALPNQPTNANPHNYCAKCNKHYASAKSYGNHVRSYHSQNREKAQCQYCGNCFTRRDNLQQHIKLFHGTKDIEFTCKFCLKNFRTKYDRKKHQYLCPMNVNSTEHKPELTSKLGKHELLSVRFPFKQTPVELELEKKNELKRSIIDGHPHISKKSKYASNEEELYSYTFINHQNETVEFHPVVDNIPSSFHQNNILEGDQYPLSSDMQDSSLKEQSSLVVDIVDENERALDCLSCNITFLSKHDYEGHKPFCEDLAKSTANY